MRRIIVTVAAALALGTAVVSSAGPAVVMVSASIPVAGGGRCGPPELCPPA